MIIGFVAMLIVLGATGFLAPTYVGLTNEIKAPNPLDAEILKTPIFKAAILKIHSGRLPVTSRLLYLKPLDSLTLQIPLKSGLYATYMSGYL